MTKLRTLFDKIWDSHVVDVEQDGTCLLYIDRHMVHEVTSPQAFAMLRESDLRVRFPHRTFATADHIMPTDSQARPLADPLAEALGKPLAEPLAKPLAEALAWPGRKTKMQQ